MSWKEDIENKIFTITTGDGRVYSPKWKNAKKDLSFNISTYAFVNVAGEYVRREQPLARRFPLEFYFDGEDCVDVGNAFEVSARSRSDWTIQHPFYGKIKGHPERISQDNSNYDVSAFTVPFIETINRSYPDGEVVLADQILQNLQQTNILQQEAFSLKPIDTENIASTSETIDKTASNGIDVADKLREFNQTKSNLTNLINSTTSTPIEIMAGTQSLINFPARLEQSTSSRINILAEMFNSIQSEFSGDLSLAQKNEYENTQGAIVGALLLAGSLNNDQNIASDVLLLQEEINDIYNLYIERLDNLQTDRADELDSFIPNFQSYSALASLHALAVSSLFQIAFEAKRENTISIESDTNIILLAHRYYGLDVEDEAIERIKNENDIGLKEIYNIPKGRKIKYYV